MISDKEKKYDDVVDCLDCVSDVLPYNQIPIVFNEEKPDLSLDSHRVLSLFSGCGGMDLGFEGQFIANRKSVSLNDPRILRELDDSWVMLRKTNFRTVFANDILPEAEIAWTTYMRRFGYPSSIYHSQSIVDLVKMHRAGAHVFPKNIDVVLGGFPCQDFSVAGKRMGFESSKDDHGRMRGEDKPSEESRGKLYYWMKQVIDIVRPKIFIAENVKGLVNLGNVKDIIQNDFASADGGGYVVLPPQVLHAGNFGVPESRERVIFIGIRKNALNAEVLRELESGNFSEELNPYPQPTHACTFEDENLMPPVTTYDVLKSLREPEFSVDESQEVYSKAKYLGTHSQGQTEIRLDGIGPTIRSEHHGNIEFRRLSAEHGGKHKAELEAGLQERRLTPRECALIQTFPPDYRFVTKRINGKGYMLSASGAYKVIGNAVPPMLAFNIATRIESLWNIYFS
ncbi:DNA (cytosine-5-)-methyltransferase [Prevotella denticola]|uniref:DNA cytosine methyltransferase n=1 Tax=Prevotella denticola TaxID=28129 RepID=UPI0009DCB31A|nr:DNA (cytosine-5-)-methyltransferase [Prevotella denticola]QUB92275.1 DNA (cytosine-5-)-methyltransferase [Prevotella denticola]